MSTKTVGLLLGITIVVIRAGSAPALAQPDSRLEVFGGYAYSTQPPDVSGLPMKHLHGWRAAGTGLVTPRFGVELELTGLSGTYASIDLHGVVPPSLRVDPPIRQLTILVGPGFKVLRAERAAVTIHALVGTVRIRRADPHSLSLSSGHYSFASSVGGSLDLNLRPRVAIRLLEPSFFLCTGRTSGCDEKSFRIASGLIFRFLER